MAALNHLLITFLKFSFGSESTTTTISILFWIDNIELNLTISTLGFKFLLLKKRLLKLRPQVFDFKHYTLNIWSKLLYFVLSVFCPLFITFCQIVLGFYYFLFHFIKWNLFALALLLLFRQLMHFLFLFTNRLQLYFVFPIYKLYGCHDNL